MTTLLAPTCSCEQPMREVNGAFECHHCDRICLRIKGTCVNCKKFNANSEKKKAAEWVPPTAA
jgi:predicted ATP-dependent serine protease